MTIKKLSLGLSLLGTSVLLSACGSAPHHYYSSNVKGCATTVGCAQVPAVRIPAVIIPTGGCGGDCYAPRRRSSVESYMPPEPQVNMVSSPYPRTYDTFCSPRM